MIKHRKWMAALILMVVGVGGMQSMGERPVITSFQGNGHLTWTNEVNRDALCHVEWAATMDGPWYRSFDNIGSVDAHDATEFQVAVPMFYRAEWEKAARGGRQGRLFPWGGDTIKHARATYTATGAYDYDISPTSGYHPHYEGEPAPTGSFPSNGYGLHDMAGNVWEWCWDRYAAYPEEGQADPRGPETGDDFDYRVLRGGSYDYDAFSARCSVRKADWIGIAYQDYGFRCVRSR